MFKIRLGVFLKSLGKVYSNRQTQIGRRGSNTLDQDMAKPKYESQIRLIYIFEGNLHKEVMKKS